MSKGRDSNRVQGMPARMLREDPALAPLSLCRLEPLAVQGHSQNWTLTAACLLIALDQSGWLSFPRYSPPPPPHTHFDTINSVALEHISPVAWSDDTIGFLISCLVLHQPMTTLTGIIYEANTKWWTLFIVTRAIGV